MISGISPLRVLVKALCLFVALNIVYAIVNPQGAKVSGYNVVFPGRTRLPFGIGGDPYTVTVDQVDAMFASHLIAAPKDPQEYRVALIGDSSIWGEELSAYEVISEQWNKTDSQCGDVTIKVYNLGYPHPSVLKDLVILDKAVEYDPDLIVWFVTLNSLVSQRINPFLVGNRERAAKILTTYEIGFQQSAKFERESNFYEKTLLGQRSNLARRIKLEMLGVVWSATGLDTNSLIPDEPPNYEFSTDSRYRGLKPTDDVKPMLLLDALAAGDAIADPIDVLVVNEPIFVATQERSSVRYNTVYPRWVYDQYRQYMAAESQNAQWNYLDLWSAVPPQYFSDAGLHLTAEGERSLVQQINPAIQSIACETKP